MPDRADIIARITARVRALLPEDWLGPAGRRFRRATTTISDYAHEKIRPRERLDEAPDLAWKAVQGAATEKHANALKAYAAEESERIDIELKRKTLRSKARQESATADKLESEARTAQIRELQERVKLFDDLKRLGAMPIWDQDGNLSVSKAPPQFDWDELQERLFETKELPPPSDASAAEMRAPRSTKKD
jgi:hypothetical protein